MAACNRREACAGGISLWQRRGRRSLSDVDTSSEEEEEGGLAELRKHAETEDKVVRMSASSDTCHACPGFWACTPRFTWSNTFQQEAFSAIFPSIIALVLSVSN